MRAEQFAISEHPWVIPKNGWPDNSAKLSAYYSTHDRKHAQYERGSYLNHIAFKVATLNVDQLQAMSPRHTILNTRRGFMMMVFKIWKMRHQFKFMLLSGARRARSMATVDWMLIGAQGLTHRRPVAWRIYMLVFVCWCNRYKTVFYLIWRRHLSRQAPLLLNEKLPYE